MSIGKNIQQLRLQHGLSQKELAIIAGVSDKTVSAWETGRIFPRMGSIQKMADFFNIKKSDIIEPVATTLNVKHEKIFSLNTDEKKLIEGYRELDSSKKSLIMTLIGEFNFNHTSAEVAV